VHSTAVSLRHHRQTSSQRSISSTVQICCMGQEETFSCEGHTDTTGIYVCGYLRWSKTQNHDVHDDRRPEAPSPRHLQLLALVACISVSPEHHPFTNQWVTKPSTATRRQNTVKGWSAASRATGAYSPQGRGRQSGGCRWPPRRVRLLDSDADWHRSAERQPREEVRGRSSARGSCWPPGPIAPRPAETRLPVTGGTPMIGE